MNYTILLTIMNEKISHFIYQTRLCDTSNLFPICIYIKLLSNFLKFISILLYNYYVYRFWRSIFGSPAQRKHNVLHSYIFAFGLKPQYVPENLYNFSAKMLREGGGGEGSLTVNSKYRFWSLNAGLGSEMYVLRASFSAKRYLSFVYLKIVRHTQLKRMSITLENWQQCA